MEIQYARSTGNFTTPGESEDLLECRMTILGLDIDAIERDYGETLDRIKQRCTSCRVRAPCALELKRDPSSRVWEAYCPNSVTLNALVALTEVSLG
jgi:hypothetical protein